MLLNLPNPTLSAIIRFASSFGKTASISQANTNLHALTSDPSTWANTNIDLHLLAIPDRAWPQIVRSLQKTKTVTSTAFQIPSSTTPRQDQSRRGMRRSSSAFAKTK